MDLTTNSSRNSSATFPPPSRPVREHLQAGLFTLATHEMPIASGATGRVDFGVDSSKRWAPDGARARPVIRQHDSYLLRYQELKELQKKNNVLKSMPEGRDPTDVKTNGVKDDMTQKTNSEDTTSWKASGGKASKTSKLCVIL